MPLGERRRKSNRSTGSPNMFGVWACMRRILVHPFVGGMLPRKGRVNPDLFPENDYPTWCLKCGYLLRGLKENRCPECGQEFDRGHLLVKEYVVEWHKWVFRPSRAGRLFRHVVLPVSMGGFLLAGHLLVFVPARWSVNPAERPVLYSTIPLCVLVTPLLVWAIRCKEYHALVRKYRRVLEATKAVAEPSAGVPSGQGTPRSDQNQ